MSKHLHLSRRRTSFSGSAKVIKEMELPTERIIAFKDDGLKAIQAIVSQSENNSQQEKKVEDKQKARKVVDMLERVGLLSFLREVWKAQDLSICAQFVQNWDRRTKTAIVSGYLIDASFNTFARLTNRYLFCGGLEAEASSLASNSLALRQTAAKSFIPAQMPKKGYILEHCTEPTLKTVLRLLNTTLWIKAHHHDRVSGVLVYLVKQADEGTRFYWKKLFHDKFVWEMSRLHLALKEKEDNEDDNARLQTVMGPVMTYLYYHRGHWRA